ncbi:hypothetical protein ANO11243_067380 [Dothideomycetidae sp. 11243]|nr:hypothetical protein ANO11243_067380 [fungal sp. No.11243]
MPNGDLGQLVQVTTAKVQTLYSPKNSHRTNSMMILEILDVLSGQWHDLLPVCKTRDVSWPNALDLANSKGADDSKHDELARLPSSPCADIVTIHDPPSFGVEKSVGETFNGLCSSLSERDVFLDIDVFIALYAPKT